MGTELLGYSRGYNKGLEEGVKRGISAVVEQCAKDHTTIYNGNTGDVMVCDGGHMGKPSETPEKALPEPPSGIPDMPEHGSIPQHMEDPQKVEEI
jgi:hypothetical protein